MCCCRWYLFRYTVSKVIIMTPILPVYYAELMSIHCHPIKPHALLRYVHVFSTYSYKFHLMLCTTHNNTSVTNVSSPTTCLVANQKQLQYWHFGAVRNCRIEQSSSRDWNFMPWVGLVKPVQSAISLTHWWNEEHGSKVVITNIITGYNPSGEVDIAPSTHSLICSLTATDCSLLNTDIWSVLVMFINTGLFSLLVSVGKWIRKMSSFTTSIVSSGRATLWRRSVRRNSCRAVESGLM